MFRERTLDQFLAEVAAKAPTPGGGSVAAVAAALGAGLGAMVIQFSFGRTESAPYEGDLVRGLREASALADELLRLADQDAAAYDGYTAATRLPKETSEQKAARRAAMQGALRHALEVPLEGMKKSLAVLRLARPLVGRSNPHLASDLGVCALLALAALRGCRLNVNTNLASIKDDAYVRAIRTEADGLEAEATGLHDEILARLRGT